ncbi:FadR/GntR family transcriptional regulator [Glutamicibacter bergerei]|jgi:GntR family transcriptional repressor for pyruvate dehydrogenase complex|uniref:FadR/GntR family transcriptional regulator n=2 Tax=Glutamicibacter TaxID=1742989 RepID=A0ABV9MKA0_9MICC|nr:MULTISPECIES: FCD domain-containing protein [Glutamicibacter]PCC36437.1 GntR family transcriptional regulator [Glutamicibacter sp. BW77]GGJ47740.1 GntR family transcriptional regulator [Glutamicibacter ardleyensis]HBV09236.1 FadR family transcriptional regulator [Micrococcaceae bacterium]HJX78899.1 FCD domain-containing protein [Glutamicibacter sp.]
MSINPAPRAYQVVLDSIESDLRSGKLALGDQLPGERALAEQHQISRASVRDAIRILDVLGLVKTSTGSGPNSGAVIISNPAAGISQALRMHLAAKGINVREIVESRILLETWAAQMPPRNPLHAQQVIDRTAVLIMRMDDAQLSREEFHRIDAEFHVLLASMAGNTVVESMMESLRHSISHYVAESIPNDESWQPVVRVLRRQHKAIHHAFATNQRERAAQLIEEHITWFYSQTR